MSETVTIIVILVATLGIVLGLRKLAFVPDKAAREYLRQGGLVIDVRSPLEFGEHHVPGALNIPLDQVPDCVLREIPDKERVLLLHCLSGGRSAVAKRRLQARGYKRVYNLGSLGRAERLVGAKGH